MFKVPRRRFLKQMCSLFAWASFPTLINPFKREANAAPTVDIYVSQNGTPVTNMQRVVEMAGGIESYIDADDVVVIKPNLQWRNQGYTHTLATKTLIELILQRPGGFNGEILIAEDHVDFDRTNQGWSATPENRVNNWPDMNYRELITDFQVDHPNVTAAPIDGRQTSGPADGPGYVHVYYTTENSPNANGRYTRMGYPILESSYSGRMIDTQNGVWEDGEYTGQNVKLIFLPTLNTHSNYAGITSAVKCHVGFVPLGGNDQYYGVHSYPERYSVGFRADLSTNRPEASGECIGELISNIIQPTLYITVAEYAGHNGRTSHTAGHTRTIGLCKDPVSLDYWMSRHVLCPLSSGAARYDPANDNVFSRQLSGCHSKGIGTMDESEMAVHLYNFDDTTAPAAPTNFTVDNVLT